ncbi:fatty-acyl-CoA synthase [Amycolatopsis bartoniae]|uniref:Putative acyl-CoA ligase n=1 Tax=Amycolatopsis bartoniae TaxID=941986 RepID=A0A8H9MB16_9PSEU|nr:acyl-CoA synthetase [Amycolatopsis bartoniae]MBB2937864.1 fatty-acyl-CoA synthase [Amycolatopsis bartoniae]TVT01326.1 acyl-CoA synthetase [Amycolatopsis bartoniae]GHF41296.1 putative acyl-CoA ligase [Amycolatopsis bartoniae]
MYPGTHADADPGRPAVVMAGSGQRLTYGELEERSTRLADALTGAGLRRGDVVALLTDNSVRAYEVYWAALRSGRYLAAVNSHLSPAEVAYIVTDSGAKALVVSAALGELAEAVAGLLPGVPVKLAYGGETGGYADYDAFLATGSPERPAEQPSGADLLYSSGTTGRPKGIKVDLPEYRVDEPGDLLTPVLQGMYGFGPDMVYLSPAPVYHAAPLRFGAAVHRVGGTLVMMERFDAEAALRAIETYRVTHSQWVPTMFVRMLKLPGGVRARYDLSSHRVAVHAAAPCPVEVKRAMIDWWGPVLYEYYAATEGAGMTFVDSTQWLAKPGTVGRAVIGVIRICDDEGRVLPPGEVGTVYFERDEVPFSYHGDPEKTREAQHPEHPTWCTIGDVGYLDEDGFLFLTDRRAFMIISGGVNIYPQEIEDALALHPAVLDVAVIGIPDPEMGESVKAVVQPAPDAVPGPELAAELLAYLRERIAHYKVPRSIDFVDELPRTPTGKLVKRRLKERYAAPAAAGSDSETTGETVWVAEPQPPSHSGIASS